MDKYDKLLDALEHPDSFTEEEIAGLLSDPDTHRVYEALCALRSEESEKSSLTEKEVELEWERFTHKINRRWFMRIMPARKGIAAAIIAVATVSVLATGISIGLKMSSVEKDANEYQDSMPVVNVESTEAMSGHDTERADTIIASGVENIVFENETLNAVLDRLAPLYKVKIRYKSDMARDIRLFFKWQPSVTLDELVEQLNTFDRIKIYLDGDTLIVD